MNLEGTLDAFGLPDVVSLLAGTGKTGGLQLRRGEGPARVQGVVWFREGRISGASSDRSRASLVRRVVGSGAVDDAALRHAVQRATGGGVGVARALLDSGAVDPDLLRQAASEQAVDAVFDLLRWSGGDFGFDASVTDADDVGISLDPAQVLGEARARAEAWARLETLVPSQESILSLPVVLETDPQVTRDEWALLALVDGRRRVRDLVELTGCGQFAVTTTLAQLVQRGLVHVTADGAVQDHVTIVERRLALLSAVEETAEPTAAEEPAAPEMPAGPGAHGMSAAEALAAARRAQGLGAASGAGVPLPGRSRQEVVPPRPEPFLPGRRPEHPEPAYAEAVAAPIAPSRPAPSAPAAPPAPAPGASVAGRGTAAVVEGSTARALAEHVDPEGVIERDPHVNRSLLLRLIAGVRGL
ncbi:MAG: DUF4388 domain-containing protein [Candidatus Nanopelagicales bacterium]